MSDKDLLDKIRRRKNKGTKSRKKNKTGPHSRRKRTTEPLLPNHDALTVEDSNALDFFKDNAVEILPYLPKYYFLTMETVQEIREYGILSSSVKDGQQDTHIMLLHSEIPNFPSMRPFLLTKDIAMTLPFETLELDYNMAVNANKLASLQWHEQIPIIVVKGSNDIAPVALVGEFNFYGHIT